MSDNREAWLGRAAQKLASTILTEESVPPLRISVGWPGGGSRKTRVGECWSTSSTADEVNQIFVSPVRGEEDTLDVLGTLLHEMIHAVDDCESGHRGNFASIAKRVGFEAPLTSADNRSEFLDAKLERVADQLGPFPHAAILTAGKAADGPQSTRMIKVACPDSDCGYILRTSQKWIDVGLPTCPCGEGMEVAA